MVTFVSPWPHCLTEARKEWFSSLLERELSVSHGGKA